MVRARELRWGAATAGVVTLTLFAVPAWSPLYADGQRRAPVVSDADDDDIDDTDDIDDIDDIDEDGCGDDDAARSDTAPTPVAVSSTSRVQTVVVRTPATAMIRVDDRGGVLAAWTNTGCVPRASDDLWLLRPDGTITAAPASIVDRAWRGDFSRAGVFVDQRGTSGPSGSSGPSHDD